MSLSLTDLLAPATAEQIRAQMVTTLVGLGVPADKWRPGGAYSLSLTVFANLVAMLSSLVLSAISMGFLPLATGPWLVLLALYVYGVVAPVATFASGNLTLTNAGGGSYTFATSAATFLDSATGQQYTNTAPFTLLPLSTLTIPVQAVTAGALGSANPGEIDTIVTVMLGVTCSNALSLVGSDAIKDGDLRALCLARLGALSLRGPRTAYYYAAISALNAGVPVNINRVSVSASSSTGIVNVSIASPGGPPTSSDLAAVVANIETVARPDGVTVNVSGASTVAYAPTLTIWVQQTPGLLASSVQSAVDTAITTYISTFPIGGVKTDAGQGLWGTGIDAVAGAAWPGIASVEGSTDLDLITGQIAAWGGSVIVRIVAVS